MTRFIVDALEVIVSLMYWIIIIVGGIASASLAKEVPFFGFVLGSVAGFITATLLCGSLFVLLEMNNNLRTVVNEITGAHHVESTEHN
jgi:hypothetical protein